MADLETLTLQITAQSQSALTAIEKLSQRLNALSLSMAKLETGKLNSLALGLDNLNTVIYNMNATSSKWDYRRIISNITSLSTIDTGRLNGLSASLGTLSNSLTGFAGVAQVSENVRTLVASISRLGGVGVQRAITNIPQLEASLSHLITSFSTLPNVSRSIIDFTNALANLASQGQNIGVASRTITTSLDRYSSSAMRATRRSHSLASAIGRVYAQFWIAMRAAQGLKKAFMAAADYLEAYNYFEVTAEKVGSSAFAKAGVGSAEAYATAFTETLHLKLKQMSGLELDLEDRLIKTTNAKSLGLNLTELTQYQASIASITDAMGASQVMARSTAKVFSMLAADMGSLKNVDFETVASNLQSALAGQARAVYKYGLDITQATLEQYAYANGIEKSVSEMTQAEKAQLRLLAILDQSKVAWGDLANTINSPSNQLRQLKNNFSELGTVLGQLFIPMMSNLLPKLNALSIALKQLMIDIAGILGIELKLDEFGNGFSDTIDEDTESLDDLNQTMKETKKGIREFDELKVIGNSKDKTGSGLSDEIDLTQQILEATNEYEKVWDEAYEKMKSKAQEIAEAISGALDPIRQIVEDFHIGNFFKAGEDVSNLVASIFDFVADAIEDVDWDGIGTKIGQFFDGIDWGKVFSSAGNLIWQAIQAAINLWTGSFSVAPFETALITAFALLKFTTLGKTLSANMANSIKSWFTKYGVDQNFLTKAGLGALSIGLSVSFTINNVTDVSLGKYAAFSFQSFAKSALSSLLFGAGFTSVTSALGLSLGPLGFAVTTGISLAVNLIAAKLNEPDINVERELAEAEYAWVEEKHLDTVDVIAKIELKRGEIDAQFFQIDDLAQKVYALSLEYDNLTDGEKNLLKMYSEQLIEIMPELASQIDNVTGAYHGSWEELTKLIEAQKESMRVNALESTMTEVMEKQYALKPDLDKLEKEWDSKSDKFMALQQQLKDMGISESALNAVLAGKDIEQALKEDEALLKKYADMNIDFKFTDDLWNFKEAIESTNYKQVYEDARAAGNAYQTLKGDWDDLQGVIDYYTEEMLKTTSNALEGMTGDAEQTDKDLTNVAKSSKLPKAVESTINAVDRKIENGEKVTKADMKDMFDGINNSFAGLGNGKVPQNVQETMDNIEHAILTNSPKLINYMATLKKQMEEAFANAHYDYYGNVIWDVNGISQRLTKDTASIREALDHSVKPTLGSLEADLYEVFGETLPEEVDKAFKALAETINKGRGMKDVLSALDNLEVATMVAGNEIGKNLSFSMAESVYAGTTQVSGAVSHMVDMGLVATTESKLEINSPSKVFKRFGNSVDEGLALGVEDDTPEVIKAMNVLVRNMQSAFAGYQFNIPSLNLGNSNRTQYGSANPYANTGNSLYENMNNANGYGYAPQEVVFRVEGDPYGIFKVVRDQNDSYRKRTNRSAF